MNIFNNYIRHCTDLQDDGILEVEYFFTIL